MALGCEDLSDRPRFGDEGDQPDVAAIRRALERKLLPHRGMSFAQTIREVSCERGFARVSQQPSVTRALPSCPLVAVSRRLPIFPMASPVTARLSL